jgi:hypothetical protein
MLSPIWIDNQRVLMLKHRPYRIACRRAWQVRGGRFFSTLRARLTNANEMSARNPQVQNPRHSLSAGRAFDFYVCIKRFQLELDIAV